MKRILVIIICGFLIFALAACSRGNQINPDSNALDIVENPPIQPPEDENGAAAPVRHISGNIINLDICMDTRRISGVSHVDFFNTSAQNLDVVYFHVPFAAFAENPAAPPYFRNFHNHIFPDGHIYGEFKIISAAVNMIPADFSLSDIWLSIHLDETLPPGGAVDIALVFEAFVPQINHRSGGNAYAMWLGNFLPTLAVLDENGPILNRYYPAGFPFFTNISNYLVEITTAPDMQISATGIVDVRERENSRLTTVNARLARDFALVIMGPEYRHIQGVSQSGVIVNLHYFSYLENVDNLLYAAIRSLDHFSAQIGSYPYRSLDLVEVGLFAPISNPLPGMIFMDSRHMAMPSAPRAISRDVAMQWFSNVVGSNSIDEPWLAAGLATYLALGVWLEPHEINEYAHAAHAALALRLPNINYPQLSRNLGHYEHWLDYYHIHHVRGMLMFYSLSQKMGISLFDNFVQTYYEAFAFQIATAAQLIQLAEGLYGSCLQDFFDGWIYQSAMPALI